MPGILLAEPPHRVCHEENHSQINVVTLIPDPQKGWVNYLTSLSPIADNPPEEPDLNATREVPPACPDLSQLRVSTPEICTALADGQRATAQQIAAQKAAVSLSDLAAMRLMGGDIEATLKALRQAVSLDPQNQDAFHNLVAALSSHDLLRSTNLRIIQRHIANCWNTASWMSQYRRLLYLPLFLNLEFVLGKCNLQCRMCVGTSGKNAADRFRYLGVDDFRKMLEIAPTVSGITLSSGNSEPLLHPEFEEIIEIARKKQINLDVFTNGLPLTSRRARQMVDSGHVMMVNFSLDAATPQTYQRIRGAEFDRVLKKIEMLNEMKKQAGAELPAISLSFVAMADNIEELPAFVDLARRFDAQRVYVEELIGWENDPTTNQPAAQHPRCREFIREAQCRALATGISLQFSGRLVQEAKDGANESSQPKPICSIPDAAPSTGTPAMPLPETDEALEICTASPNSTLAYCSWLNGVWVEQDGRLDPCCLIHNVVDLGTVRDGPLLLNEKYTRVKEMFLQGWVLPQCVNQRACQYVQQQKTAGIPLRIIPPAELDLTPTATSSSIEMATSTC